MFTQIRIVADIGHLKIEPEEALKLKTEITELLTKHTINLMIFEINKEEIK